MQPDTCACKRGYMGSRCQTGNTWFLTRLVAYYWYIKEGLYRIWCGVNSPGDSGVNTLGDTSAFVNPTVQQLLTWRSKIRMDGVGIVFEFYIAPL